MWLSFPPIGLSWLAWIAPVPILMLVLQEQRSRTSNRRPGRKIWLATFFYWMATFYFLPWPHPVLYVGWFALSAYLAVYMPLFVAASRVMIHRWSVSPLIAVPIAGTGFEWIRVNFLTGFGMVCLSHSQADNPLVIQIAELCGAYTVTFFILAIATAFAMIVNRFLANLPSGTGIAAPTSSSRVERSIVPAILVLILTPIAVLGWGSWRLGSAPAIQPANIDTSVASPTASTARSVRIALIQSSIDTVLRSGLAPEEAIRIQDEEFAQRIELTRQAREQFADIDLIVWPESAFPTPDRIDQTETASLEESEAVLATTETTPENFAAQMPSADALAYAQAIAFCHQISVTGQGKFEPIPMLTGTTTFNAANDGIYNAAILIDSQGRVSDRYFKHHRVMIGEYLPIVEYFPSLARLSPVGRGLTPGRTFSNFTISGLNVAPNICFETTVPHFIRRQVKSLTHADTPPDVLLNITNDGWFFGSSCLDFHFACNVFRAVEMRTPMLVCANTGFSASVDAYGRVLKKGLRRQPEILICDVPVSAPTELATSGSISGGSMSSGSIYRTVGDIPVGLMGIVSVFAILWARWTGRTVNRPLANADLPS